MKGRGQGEHAGAGGAPTDGVRGAAHRHVARRRARRRRVVLGFAKLVFWMIVLGAVFVVGIGLGHQLGADEAGTDGRTLTVDGSRGEVVATLPTKTVTVTKTETVVRRVPARANPRARRGR